MTSSGKWLLLVSKIGLARVIALRLKYACDSKDVKKLKKRSAAKNRAKTAKSSSLNKIGTNKMAAYLSDNETSLKTEKKLKTVKGNYQLMVELYRIFITIYFVINTIIPY